jgi:glycoprotein 6-alpha-L-fucosyltransferase
LPPAIPRDLSERIIRLHGDPIVWWVAEFLRYILRTQPDTAKMLEETEKGVNFERPIVGIHVRRTDKVGTEAAFHAVDEYMKYVRFVFFLRSYCANCATNPGKCYDQFWS